MRIAVDAMGGDYAPENIVAGAVEAAGAISSIQKLYLVGDRVRVQAELDKASASSVAGKIELVEADEVVAMDEAPASAIRKKKRSSISLSIDLVKNGDADAVFSAGNTGAAVAATTLKLRTLDGVQRPAIATVMPTMKGPFILIDAGANPDCTSNMLVEFGVMGSIYAREILGIDPPKVGLLSIGGEESKGNVFTKETLQKLRASPLNFIGNVEGHDLFEGNTDVVVCDGFVGNVVLKTSESAAHAMSSWLKKEFTKNPWRTLGALMLKGAIGSIKQKTDPAKYGGAPLLGVNGVCIIGHGSSSPTAVFNGIRVAAESVHHQINHLIIEMLAGMKQGWHESERL